MPQASLLPTTIPAGVPSIGRRHILAGIGMAAIGTAATASANVIDAHPDAALLVACAHYTRLEDAYHATMGGPDDMAEPAGYDASIDAIAAIPAQTIEGLRAKAKAIRHFYGDNAGDYGGGGLPHKRMEWSLLMDLAGGAQ